MYLIKFLLVGAVLAGILGEFGRFPFGASGGAVSAADLLILLTLAFSFIWISITHQKIKIPSAFKLIMVFWVVGLVSLSFSASIFPLSSVAKGSLYLLRFMLYSSIFLVVYNLKKARVFTMGGAVNLLIFTGTTLAGIGLLQFIFYPNFDYPLLALADFGYDPHRGRLASTFLDPNFAGAYFCLTGGLIVYRLMGARRKGELLGLLTIMVAVIVLTFSRSAYLMAGVLTLGLSVWYWEKMSRSLKVILPVGIIAVLLLTGMLVPRFSQRILGGISLDETARERIISWQAGLTIARVNPVTGIGFNNVAAVKEDLNLYRPTIFEEEHSSAGLDSSLILVLATTGILGLAVYIFWWVATLRGLVTGSEKLGIVLATALIALIINSQFINSLFFPPVMIWYFLLLGMKEA